MVRYVTMFFALFVAGAAVAAPSSKPRYWQTSEFRAFERRLTAAKRALKLPVASQNHVDLALDSAGRLGITGATAKTLRTADGVKIELGKSWIRSRDRRDHNLQEHTLKSLMPDVALLTTFERSAISFRESASLHIGGYEFGLERPATNQQVAAITALLRRHPAVVKRARKPTSRGGARIRDLMRSIGLKVTVDARHDN